MHGTYNYYLVGLSLLVAMYASYTALDLAGRIRSTHRARRKHFFWLLGGAASMGMGIWSMHFIGMLAFRMPISFRYDPWITAGSLLIAIVVSGFALYVVTRDELSRMRLASGGVLMGLGIASMHYTGMASLRMHPRIVNCPILFWGSIAIAIVASWAALWISFTLRDSDQKSVLLKRCGAGLVMGLAIAAMHYTGMSAAIFQQDSISLALSGMDSRWLVVTVTGATLCVLTMTLIFSMLDALYDLQEDQLRATQEKAELNAVLANANEKLLTMATEDAVTGLPNRISLVERMENAIRSAHYDGNGFVVMFMDLDGFKAINDSLGHTAGDQLLKAFARHLVSLTRHGDTVARLGGDEFVVMLEHLNMQQEVASFAEAILRRMQHEFLIDRTPLRVTASIGIAVYPHDGTNIEDLLKNADTAMCEAKHLGRNTYRFFRPELGAAAARTTVIHASLADALEHDDFFLEFQPKFRGHRREIVGAEALIRWKHPVLGDIQPMEFIPVAERTGLIIAIGECVIRKVCRQIREWDEAKVPLVKVAINLSQEQLRNVEYVDHVRQMVADEGVEPKWLMFEITESAAMRNPKLAISMIGQFQRAGFDMAIDDFGTGYSSLAYLQQFRVKQLKVDHFFTEGLDKHGEEGFALVSAIIALAHALNMVVVAEGVETQTQLALLQQMQCDELQGFLLSTPLRAEAFQALLCGVGQKESADSAGRTSKSDSASWHQSPGSSLGRIKPA